MTYVNNLLDWSYNANKLGFAQAMVQYGTDVYHYSAANNLKQTLQGSTAFAKFLGLPSLGLVKNLSLAEGLILASYGNNSEVKFSDFRTGDDLGSYNDTLLERLGMEGEQGSRQPDKSIKSLLEQEPIITKTSEDIGGGFTAVIKEYSGFGNLSKT
ncbi:MAG: hypothetical protein WAW13_05190, partial [Minisyncoccia bacterium]